MSFEDEIAADNPVAWWKMDASSQGGGQLEDYGSGTDADLDVNGPVLGEPTLVSGSTASMRFRGAPNTDYCARAGTPAKLQVSGAFSIESLVLVPSTKNTLGTIFCERYGDGNIRYALTGYNGTTDTRKPSFGWLNGFGAMDLATSPDDLTQDEAHHVIGTYDGSDLRIYVDGALKDTTTPSTAQPGGSGNIQIGLRWDNALPIPSDPNEYFTGTLQHVVFYDTELSSGRVLDHYNAGFAPPVSVEPSGFSLAVSFGTPTVDVKSPINLPPIKRGLEHLLGGDRTVVPTQG